MGDWNREFCQRINIIATCYSQFHSTSSAGKWKAVHYARRCTYFKKILLPLWPIASNRKKFFIDISIVQRGQLLSNVVSIEAIKNTFELDQKDSEIVPYIETKSQHAVSFWVDALVTKCSFFGRCNRDVGDAINIRLQKEHTGSEHSTTAWFVILMYKWFKLMTGRYFTYLCSFTS